MTGSLALSILSSKSPEMSYKKFENESPLPYIISFPDEEIPEKTLNDSRKINCRFIIIVCLALIFFACSLILIMSQFWSPKILKHDGETLGPRSLLDKTNYNARPILFSTKSLPPQQIDRDAEISQMYMRHTPN